MKLFLCFVAILAVTQATDWSKVKFRDIDPITRRYVPHNEGRIVGGEEAEANSYPYQAALMIDVDGDTYFCGGSLISLNYILTAAHCVDGASEAEVILGAHNVREIEETQVRYLSSEFIVHAGWNVATLINDIALIKLPEPAKLSKYVQIIPLPKYADADNTFSGEMATVSGWGKDSDSATAISSVLRFVNVNVITNLVCELNFLGIIHDSNICTGGGENQGACNGDSGGPLVIGTKQVGLVSFGISLGCELGWPSVYTRTTRYLDWLAFNSDATIT